MTSPAAIFSPCRTYRYELARSFGGLFGSKRIAFLMLNPSTADETSDDPTIRRCIGFAKRDGASELRIINLFALRSTDPNALLEHADPIGPDNDAAILRVASSVDLVVCAWGAFKYAASAGVPRRADVIKDALCIRGVAMACLGVTQDGSPRHPLYVPADAPFIPFR